MNTTNRIQYWDVSKAIAIFLVVWGHCLQNLTTDSAYWLNDRVSQCIISFHMPVFMLISGYFAYSSLTKPFGKVMMRKVKQLFIPSITWFLIVSFLAIIIHRDFTYERLYGVIITMFTSYWFLKSLFMCYLLTLIGAFLYRWKTWALWLYVIGLIAIAEPLNYVCCVSMLPFFGAGLLYHRFQQTIESNHVAILLVSLCCYIAFFVSYESAEYNIYLHPFEWSIGGGKSYIIRCVLGLSGSVVFISLIKWLCNMLYGNWLIHCIAKIGSMTLGIYCIQVILAEGAFKHLSLFVEHLVPYEGLVRTTIYDVVITPLATLVTIVFCYIAINIIRKNRYLQLLLLGEEKK